MINIDLIGMTGKNEPLDNKLSIYVPSRSEKEVNPLRFKQWHNGTIELLNNLFFGSTELNGQGYWTDANSQVVIKEDVTIVYSNFKDSQQDKIKQVISFCEGMKHGLKQDAISLEINGTLLFI